MAKPNTYLQLLNAQKEISALKAEISLMKGFTLQQSLDMAMITLNRTFGFGPDRNGRFEDAFRATFREYAQLCVSDGADDPEIEYTKAIVDRALQEACGNILPFDERYAPDNLYLRSRDIKEERPSVDHCG